MRISEVTPFHLRAHLREELGGSARRRPIRVRESLIVRVSTDDGLVGFGECSGPPRVVGAAVDHLAPLILGGDPLKRQSHANGLLLRAREEGPGGLLFAAAGGIDMALWDLTGKALGIPISVLLGGPVRDAVKVYAASVYFGSLSEAVRTAEQLAGAGFDAIKVKVGMGLDSDDERVAAIRETLGPAVKVLLDANGAYDAKTAISLAQRVARHEIYWIEEPVPASDLEGAIIVRNAGAIRTAGGEALHTRFAFEPWLSRRALDVAMPDLGRCGGLTEAAAIAAMAAACRIAVSPHCWGCSVGLAASVHLAAALPNCEILEFDAHPDPLRDALLGAQLRPDKALIRVPEGPGLGVEIDSDALLGLAIPPTA